MYAGFNLNITQNCGQIPFSEYQWGGKKHLELHKNTIRNELKELVFEGTNILDGTAIQNTWFPELKADIFISHSHKDIVLAEGLAGWLYKTFGLHCFIDSNVWGYADELLEMINSEYSNKRRDPSGGFLYDHQRCIAASKHVNTMLTLALHKMIDRCECIFLLNTDNSIQRYKDIPHDTTFSPWIYSEIVCSQLIRKQPLINYRKDYVIKHDGLFESAQAHFQPAYKVTTEHLFPLDVNALLHWENKYHVHHWPYPLDILYTQIPENQVNELCALFG